MRGRAILAVGLISVAMPAAAQTLPNIWTADARTGCRAWSANQQLDGSVTWSGACLNGAAHLPGVRQWSLGEAPYDVGLGGLPVAGVGNRVATAAAMSGRGVVTWANGDRYDGDWWDGNINGQGVGVWADGDRYDGEWRDGKQDGRGTQIDADGSRFEGVWRNGLPNGIGRLVLTNGDSYSGVWVNGCYRNGSQRALFDVDPSACR